MRAPIAIGARGTVFIFVIINTESTMQLKALASAMEQELMEVGFAPLKTKEAVKTHMEPHQGTTLLFVNSLCGCAGTGARLGVKMALSTSTYLPNHLVTIFAGVDDEAAAQVCAYTKPYPPSSPAIALFKDSVLVHFIERHQLKGSTPEDLDNELQQVLKTHCQQTVVA